MTITPPGPPYRAVWLLLADGTERPGLELARSELAVTVRYVLNPGAGNGTATDTVRPERVRPFAMYATGGGYLD